MDEPKDDIKTAGEGPRPTSTPRVPAGAWVPGQTPKRQLKPHNPPSADPAKPPATPDTKGHTGVHQPGLAGLPERRGGVIKEWLALAQDIAYQKRVRVAAGEQPPEKQADPERGLVTPLIRDIISMMRRMLKKPRRLLMLMFIGITLFPMIRAVGTAAWLPSSSKALMYPLIISIALIAFALGKHVNKQLEGAGRKQDCGVVKRYLGIRINRRWTSAVALAIIGILCAIASEGVRYRCVVTLPYDGEQLEYLQSKPVEERAAAEAELKRETVFLPLIIPERIKDEAKYNALRDESEGNVWSMAYLDTEYLNVLLISHASFHRFLTILIAILLYSGTILSLTVACALTLDIDDPELQTDPDANPGDINDPESIASDTDVGEGVLEWMN